jgi:NAD(P)-dependent dehydrogenase (short-subunit alcohol dehydrogenase family)
MSGPLDLTGSVVLVTGGNRGIGLGMAQGLAEAGAHVYIWGSSEERNLAAEEELREYGSVRSMTIDIGDEGTVAAGFEQLVSEAGRLDACFANAGVHGGRKPLLETTLDDIRAVTRINLDGTFVTLREAARQMVALGNGGSLVATSSLGAVMGQGGGYAYAASKAALVAIVKALAVDLARHKIRANAILPGWIETEMTANSMSNPKFVGNVMPRMPLRRWGTGEDFAGIAVYLASQASAFHTGDTILIDGGYSIY